MRYKYHLTLMISTAIFILSACGIESVQQDNTTSEMPISAETEVEDTVESVKYSSNVSAKELNDNSDAEETGQTATAEDLEETSTDEDSAQEDTTEDAEDKLAVMDESAIKALAHTTDLEITEYSYIFTHKADYIEIEVRDATEDDESYAVLQGIYRYYPVTQQVYIRDYLTGDFILYQEYQKLNNN